jgi:superfamily I DNA and RNA helicase
MKVVQQQQPESIPLPPVEEVAQAIVDIAATVKRMNSTRLTQEAIIVLLYAQCRSRVNKSDIQLVLSELGRMDRRWLKPLEEKKR